MADAARKSPEEQVKDLERYAAQGNLALMMEAIGELHERWNLLGPDTQQDVKKMEAVFLSMLKARAAAKKE